MPKRPPRPVSADLSWRLVRQNGRPADIVAFEESVVEFFLEAAEALAVPKSLAAIYGVCFASPVPLSFSEVRDRLGISSGSVSQGLRILQNVNALKVVTSPHTKRELFEPDLELRKLIAHYLEERVEKQLNSGRDRLQAIVQAIPEGPDGSGKILRARLKSSICSIGAKFPPTCLIDCAGPIRLCTLDMHNVERAYLFARSDPLLRQSSDRDSLVGS